MCSVSYIRSRILATKKKNSMIREKTGGGRKGLYYLKFMLKNFITRLCWLINCGILKNRNLLQYRLSVNLFKVHLFSFWKICNPSITVNLIKRLTGKKVRNKIQKEDRHRYAPLHNDEMD